MPGKEVVNKVRESVEFTSWEKEVYEKTGCVRWESILHFVTVDCAKAGFMRKSKGIWYLTKEGEDAIKLGDIGLLESANAEYRKWSSSRSKEPDKGISNIEETLSEDQFQQVNLENLLEQARDGIKKYIIAKNPYEFQDLVAALLRAMDYHTPFISPKGKDGGIDIIAYQDPLGIKKPRIKVQIKHRPDTPISSESVRSLKGLINIGEEIGLFVTSGRFSNEA